MILIATVPSLETFTNWLRFEDERRKLDIEDFTKKIKHNKDVLETMALVKGISVDKLKEEMAESLKGKAITELEKKYGFSDEKEEDKITDALQKYRDFADQMHNVKEQPNYRDLIFKNPLLKKETDGDKI